MASSRVASSRTTKAERPHSSRRTWTTGNLYDSDSDVSFVRPYSDSTKANGIGPNLSPRTTASHIANAERSRSSKITSNPHDSYIGVSFVLPCDDEKRAVHLPALISTLTTNANHLIQTFVASDIESSSEDSDDSRRATVHVRKAVLLMEKAGLGLEIARRYAASLQVANRCLGLVRDEGHYSSSEESEHKHTRRTHKMRASEAKPHDGTLGEEISVTTDAYSCSTGYYNSAVSDERTAESSSSSDASVAPIKAGLDTLRRRRKAFLRRRAQERAAGTDTEEDEDTVVNVHKRLALRKKTASPILELPPRIEARSRSSLPAEAGRATTFTGERKLWPKARNCSSPELRCNEADVFPIKQHSSTADWSESAATSMADSLLNTTYEDDVPQGNTSIPSNETMLPFQSHAPQRLSSHSTTHSSKPKWYSMDKEIENLSLTAQATPSSRQVTSDQW